MVWIWEEEGHGVYWRKDLKDGAAKQKEKRKTTEMVHIYVANEDMQSVGMIELDISDEVKLKQMIH